tara:strand:+ start:23 stop:670 length:648 start_codon:yes stop_codon:yes gene_type:complete
MKVIIPESLNEIKLHQYQKWLKVSDNNDDNNFLKQKMVEIFCNISLRDVLNIKSTDIDLIIDDLNKVFNQEPKFIDRFDYNKKRFGFIPKLDDITFGEYVDLDNYLPDWHNMHLAMNVLFRPITLENKKGYFIEDYDGSDKHDMRNITLDVVFGAVVFFWNLKNELLNITLNYLGKQTPVDLPPAIKDFLKSGDGINRFMDWPKGMFEDLMKLQD